MTSIDSSPTAAHATDATAASRRSRWPIIGVAAGALGMVATLFTDLHPAGVEDRVTTPAIVDEVSRVTAHVGLVAGYVVVGLLLWLAAAWRVHVSPRVSASVAAHVVPVGLTAAAGALALGYGYKGMLAVYLEGGIDEEGYDTSALYVMYVLNDFGGYIGWLGVLVSAIAVAWMSLREHTISRWIGLFTLLPILGVCIISGGLGVPGFPGVVMPLWLVVTSLGLTFGKSPIVR
ncbi:MAG: hypothetical protein WB767_08405 [Nocardioides sp.]